MVVKEYNRKGSKAAAIIWWQYQKDLLNDCAKIICSKVFIGVLYLLKKPSDALHFFQTITLIFMVPSE